MTKNPFSPDAKRPPVTEGVFSPEEVVLANRNSGALLETLALIAYRQPLTRGEIEEVLVIADPKTLGEMRQHYHTELRRKLAGEIDKTLTGLPIDKIEAAIDAA